MVLPAAIGAIPTWGSCDMSDHRKVRKPRSSVIKYGAISAAALRVLPALLDRWLPGGHCVGREYVVRNPTRHDAHPGSFSINMQSGRWGDFSVEDYGKDIIALAAYLSGLRQSEAALRLAEMLGIDPVTGGRRGP